MSDQLMEKSRTGRGSLRRGVDDTHMEEFNSGEAGVGRFLGAEESAIHSEETAKHAGEGAVLKGSQYGEERDVRPSLCNLGSTVKLGDAVEDDARAVAKSLSALLASLKSALSEVTRSSVDHMLSENEAAGQLQDAAIDAATKGTRFVNACLRLNEEMKGMSHVAAQLESLRQRVDQFENQSNQYLLHH